MLRSTKMKFIVSNVAMIFLFNVSFARENPSHFKCEIDFGSGTVISTFLDLTITRDQFTLTSPENADVRIIGGSKAKLGRLLGKMPKKGRIVTIKGAPGKDSLSGNTAIPMFGKLKFKGRVKDETLSGELVNSNGTSVGTLHGVASEEDRIDYTGLFPKISKTIKDNIYSKDVLQTKEWKKFEKGIAKLCNVAHDDIELFFGFSMLSRKLPFTHLNLLIVQDTAENDGKNTTKSVVFEEKNSTTAYLQIKNFSSSTAELAAVLPQIVENAAFKNLIIDLRDNGGGGVGPAFELAKYIVTEDLEVGYFVTNKLHYSGFEPGLFRTLPSVQPKSTEELGDQLKTSAGVKLIFKKPANPVFAGNIYVLTNGNTGSTCEPMVYVLKNRKKATIIGEKTYGGMLAASPFVVSGKYMLMLPVADFYTYDGVRLDKVGVRPDIEVKSEDALNKALEIINAGRK